MNSGQEHPRLGVGHILLWVTVCAFFFSLIQLAAQTPATGIGVLRAAAIVVLESIPVTAAIVVIARLVRGVRYPIQAGEWLLFVLGIAIAIQAIVVLWPQDSIFVPTTIAAAATCCVRAIPTLSRRLHWVWKCFFVLYVMTDATLLSLNLAKHYFVDLSISPTLETSLYWFIDSVFTPTIACVAPWLIGIWRSKNGEPGNWSHWLGIASFTIWHAFSQLIQRA